MSFKRTKVVMLPTNEKAPFSDIILAKKYNLLHHTKHYGKAWTDMGDVYQHLYFLSDEEIKEGDWALIGNDDARFPAKCPNDDQGKFWEELGGKKIIATTDKLEIPYQFDKWSIIPQPSEGFIQKFIESYGDGKTITEVDVEFERFKERHGDGRQFFMSERLKVNPKDNTITIKKVKDTWTLDEVINLLQQFNNDKPGEFDCSKWIEENL